MTYHKLRCFIIVLTSISNFIHGQIPELDTLKSSNAFGMEPPKPRTFLFITSLPKTFAYSAKETFRSESIPALSLLTISTLLFIPIDQSINNEVNRFSRSIDLNPEREYKTLIGFDLGNLDVDVYDAPQNLNTVFYSIGEGSTSILICAGLFLHGKIKKNNKSLQVSSQLLQSLLAVGITTQFIKRVSGRESPFVATASGGKWRPFTNPVTYQSKVPSYDAFPSGHLATMMATTTVLTLNYPEKKWIKPIGYGLIGLVGLAMVNNGVHWTSDYPLALGIGYVFGKVSFSMNKWVKGER
ncbi:MAG: phosphatase PAP2 family protein [Cyclobacteriaceae bacterium]